MDYEVFPHSCYGGDQSNFFFDLARMFCHLSCPEWKQRDSDISDGSIKGSFCLRQSKDGLYPKSYWLKIMATISFVRAKVEHIRGNLFFFSCGCIFFHPITFHLCLYSFAHQGACSVVSMNSFLFVCLFCFFVLFLFVCLFVWFLLSFRFVF